MRFLLVLLAAVAAMTSQVHAKQLAPFHSGPWAGAAYGDDYSGHFTSCIASAGYVSGIVMTVMVTREWEWQLGFSSDQWRLREGATIPLQYRFDRGPWHRAVAEAIAVNQVRIPMPTDGDVVENFRRRLTMHIHDGRQYFSFDLKGTSRLLADLADCVVAQVAAEQPSGGIGIGTAQDTGPADVGDVAFRLEGTRVLSNFLLAAGLPGTIIGPETTPDELKDFHAVALAGNQLGFTMVLPDAPSGAPQEITGALLATVSNDCTGQFASGSSTEGVEGVALTTGFAACRTGEGVSQLRYVVTPRSGKGLYLIGIMSADLSDAYETEPADQISKGLLMEAAFRASQ